MIRTILALIGLVAVFSLVTSFGDESEETTSILPSSIEDIKSSYEKVKLTSQYIDELYDVSKSIFGIWNEESGD